jgi:nitrogen fixation protein NifU and related proteins
VAEEIPTDDVEVRRRLKRVMNPEVGLDLIRTRVVSEVEVSGGVVRVVLSLSEDSQFANNIREEIIEKIEPIWDVDEVIVEFEE